MADFMHAIQAFWQGKKASGKQVESTGDKLLAKNTVILQRKKTGEVIANTTRYKDFLISQVQKQAQLKHANLIVSNVEPQTKNLTDD